MSVRHAIRNFLLTLNYMHPAAMGIAVRRGPNAAKRYLSEIYRCSKTDAGLYLPVITLDKLAGVSTEFVVVRPSDWYGSMTITEISSLCYLVAARHPRKILELGTFQGLTTLNMALNAPQASVHSLDLPLDIDPSDTQFDTNDAAIIKRRDGYYYAARQEASRIRQYYGDTAKFDFEEIGDGVDFCLIDAAHSYEYVRNDTAKVLTLMAEESLLLWHDYGRNDFMVDQDDAWGVTRFLQEIADFGVSIIQGTSFGVLLLSGNTRQELIKHLQSSDKR